MIHRVFIANRGEIAARIIRTAREMGIYSVVSYSPEDGENALYARTADLAVPIEGKGLSETYLNINKMIRLARDHHCDAIHPGYGFLSENPDFAKAVEEAGLTFVGPAAEVVAWMGNKVEARKAAKEAGLPVVEGMTGDVKTLEKAAPSLEFPVLVKAAAGGGGKGMKIAHSKIDFVEMIRSTSREAKAYFGDDQLYLEKYVPKARHIEVQVMADHHGNAIHLFERECSVQRRYQKIIEESPSVFISADTWKSMTEDAVRLVKEINYRNAGTIEFLVDAGQNYYFLEMNTRIQVEHPVTEMVTGLDLVKMQFQVAMGEVLPVRQEDLHINGHAIEARLYAEDPENNFRPSPGHVTLYQEPYNRGPRVRVDSSLDGPVMIHPDYDPMISKLIVHAEDRHRAIEKMKEALRDYVIQGLKTNREFLFRLMHHKQYVENKIDTSYCDKNAAKIIAEVIHGHGEIPRAAQVAGLLLLSYLNKPEKQEPVPDPWKDLGYWRNCMCLKFFDQYNTLLEVLILRIAPGALEFYFARQRCLVHIHDLGEHTAHYTLDGTVYECIGSWDDAGDYYLNIDGIPFWFKRSDILPEKEVMTEGNMPGFDNDMLIRSPIHGQVVKVNVKEGKPVNKGDVLIIIDSMKMENNILAPRNAKIKKVHVRSGEQVELNKALLDLN